MVLVRWDDYWKFRLQDNDEARAEARIEAEALAFFSEIYPSVSPSLMEKLNEVYIKCINKDTFFRGLNIWLKCVHIQSELRLLLRNLISVRTNLKAEKPIDIGEIQNISKLIRELVGLMNILEISRTSRQSVEETLSSTNQ